MLLIDKDNYKLTDNEITESIENIALDNDWNIYDISTSQFNYILSCIGEQFFHRDDNNKSILFYDNNKYNINILLNLCKYYISICIKYNKAISIYGYSNMCNIDMDVVEAFQGYDLTSDYYFLYKSLNKSREQYIKDKLTDSNNVVGAIAVANHEYKWTNGNNSGNTTINVLSGSSLPDLIAKIADNKGVQALPPSE